MAYILTISNSDIEFRHIEDKQNESYLMHQSASDIRISTEDDLRSEQYIMLVHQVEGGGIPEAPNDGKLYGRKNKLWSRAAEPEEVAEAISQTLEIAEEEIADARAYAESVAEAAYQAGKRDLEDAQEIMETVTERIDNRLTEVDTELTEKLEEAKERIANAEENISDAQVNIDRANANIDLHAERLDVAEGTLTDVGLRVNAAEGAIDAQTTHIDTLEGTVSDVGLRLDAAEGTIVIHNNRLNETEDSVTVMEQKWDNVEATITTTVATQIATSGSTIKTGVEQIVDGKAGVIEQNAVKTVEENMDGYITSNTHFSQLRQDTEGIKATVGDATDGLVKKVSVLEQTSDNIALRVTDAEHALDDGHGGLLSVGEIKVTADTISNVVTNGDNFAAIIARINAATGSSEVLLDANKIYLLGETVAEKLTALQAVIGNLSVVNTSVEGTIGSYGRSDGEHTEAELLQMLLDGTITKSQYDSYKTVTNWQLKSDGTGSLAKGNITWDQNGNATFTGNVVANSLSLGSTVTIPSDNISGLSAIATSGDYDDIINPPHIPDDSEITGLVDTFVKSNGILDLQGNVGSLITNYVTTRGYQTASDVQAALEELDYNSVSIVDSEPDDKGIITRTITVIPNGGEESTYIEYYSQDGKYLITDVGYGSGHFDDREETAAGVLISTDGLIKAKNAIIYGTIYSHAGQIGGWTIAQNRLLSSFPTTSGNGTTYLSLHPGMEGSTLADNNGIRSYTVVTSGTDPVPGTYTHYWLKADGSGEIANGSLTWNKYGVITLSNLNGNVILSNSGQTLDQLLALVSTVANMFEWDNDQTSPGYGSIRTKRVLDPITGQWTSPSFYTYGEITAGGVGTGGSTGGGIVALYAKTSGADVRLDDTETRQAKFGISVNGSLVTPTNGVFDITATASFDDLTGRPKYSGSAMTSSTNIPEVKTSVWDGKQASLGTGTNGQILSWSNGAPAWTNAPATGVTSLNGKTGAIVTGSGLSVTSENVLTNTGVLSVGSQTGAITLRGGQTANGSVNLAMSGTQLQASIVGLGNLAYQPDVVTALGYTPYNAANIGSASVASANMLNRQVVSDLNDATQYRFWESATNSPTHSPVSSWMQGLTVAMNNNPSYRQQLAIASSRLYVREQNEGAWGTWRTVALTSDIPTNNNQLANGANYITSSGSCAYATNAGQLNGRSDYYHTGNSNNTSTPWTCSNLTASGNIYLNNPLNSAAPYWISAGPGYGNGSGKYGVKVLCCDQSDAQTGLGQDCVGDLIYDFCLVGGQSGSSYGYISFVFHQVNSTSYHRAGYIDFNHNLVMYGEVTAGSDKRWKHNITPVLNGIDAIMKLNPCTWEWNSDNHKGSGLVAQQTREVLPHLVKEDSEGYLHLTYDGLHAYEISALQSHETRIQQLERENADLKRQLQQLNS